jgi:hypothetical protein
MVHKGTIIVYIMNTDMWQEVQINNMIKHMYMYYKVLITILQNFAMPFKEVENLTVSFLLSPFFLIKPLWECLSDKFIQNWNNNNIMNSAKCLNYRIYKSKIRKIQSSSPLPYIKKGDNKKDTVKFSTSLYKEGRQ